VGGIIPERWAGSIRIVGDIIAECRARSPRNPQSTVVTSQLPVAPWHEVIGQPTYADAILDRLVYNAHRLDLDGDSMRRAKSLPHARRRPSTKQQPA